MHYFMLINQLQIFTKSNIQYYYNILIDRGIVCNYCN